MAWLRLDDGFASHPKILALSEVQRWRWVTLLLACARHSGHGGRITAPMLKAAGLNAPDLVELGLLDPVDNPVDNLWMVHDWDDFNRAATSAARRQSRYRENKRKAELSGIGGDRYVTRDDDVTVAPRARSRPVLSSSTTPTSTQDVETIQELSRTDDDLVFPSIGGLATGHELLVTRLLAAVGRIDAGKADSLRAYAGRAPEAVVARILERFGVGDVHDRYGYAMGTLRRELGS